MNARKRLERLEAENSDGFAPDPSYWAAMVLCKHHERLTARREGREPPPYSQEEIEEMRRDDLEVAAGGGVVGWLREGGGWQSEEARAKLDGWEQDARRRLEQAESLPPERWCEVWGADD